MMYKKNINKDKEQDVDKKGDLLLTWANDTICLFEKEVKIKRAIDHLCITSLTVSLTYCMAIVSLLKIGIRMPAKALLRVLFELGAKLVWSMVMPEGKDEPNDDIIAERIKRWAKSSLELDVKYLKGIIDYIPDEYRAEAQKRIENSMETMDTLGCEKEMPKFFNMIGQLPEVWTKQLYPQCYLQFNNAVHLDINSLGKQVSEGTEHFKVVSDDNDDVDLLMQYCMSLEHIILWIVRHHYGWETEKMDKEFKS